MEEALPLIAAKSMTEKAERGIVLIVREQWVDNRGVRLHVLESNEQLSQGRVSVLFIPGMLGTAESYLMEITELRMRRCVALTLRGCGKSDAPERGYAFEDYVSDIQAVVEHFGLDHFCLMGYSAGVPRVIQFAVDHPGKLAGLILGDYPAGSPPLTQEWVENTLTSFPDLAKPRVVYAMKRELTGIMLWERLGEIDCPVLVMKGGRADSLLKPERVELYQRYLKKPEIIVLEGSGHMLSKPDHHKYLNALKAFLERLDAS